MSTASLEQPISRTASVPAVGRAGVLERIQYPAVALLLLIFFIVGWQGREPSMRAAGEDEFVYLALSKSIQSGSYREIFRAHPPLHVQYPPAYPAWLTVLRSVVGENHDVIRVTNLLMAAAALLVMFLVMRRLAGLGFALLLLLLLVLNRDLLRMSGAIVSENLFLLAGTAALAWTLGDGRTRGARPGLAIALGLLAFLTRSIGLAVVAGIGVWLLSHRSWRALWKWGIASAAVVGGWFVYTVLAADSTVRSYTSDFAAVSASTGGTISHLAHRVWSHGVEYATSGMPYALSLPTIAGTRLDNWAWLLLNVILLGAGWLVLWKRWRAAAAYVPAYVGLVLLWPYMDGRLLVPLIPLGLLTLLLGAQQLLRPVAKWPRRLALGAWLALLTLGAGRGALERLAQYRHCDRSNPFVSPGCYRDETLALAAAANYLREHAPAGEIVLSPSPASMNYLSNHPAEPVSLLGRYPPATIADSLRGRQIRFVVVTEPWAAGVLIAACSQFQLTADFSPFAVLLSTAGPDARDQACAALRKVAGRRIPTPG